MSDNNNIDNNDIKEDEKNEFTQDELKHIIDVKNKRKEHMAKMRQIKLSKKKNIENDGIKYEYNPPEKELFKSLSKKIEILPSNDSSNKYMKYEKLIKLETKMDNIEKILSEMYNNKKEKKKHIDEKKQEPVIINIDTNKKNKPELSPKTQQLLNLFK